MKNKAPYTIPAKPTKYKGRIYRSRLEARVAAWFDLMNWTYEYEPFDIDGWSPDFLTKTNEGNSIVVEVKPSGEFFDITKYFKNDFKKYPVLLLTPEYGVLAGIQGVDVFNIKDDNLWIQSANEVMFLKPKI